MTYTPAVLPLVNDNRVYHLQLSPEELADTVITVGDQARVERVSRHFDSIEHRIAHREFVTHTGYLQGRRLSVLSTGIGTSNIDIVLNEIDALKNIHLENRIPYEETKCLTIIRFGTTGGLAPTLSLGSIVLTKAAIGLDGLLNYYQRPQSSRANALQQAFTQHMGDMPIRPYAVAACPTLIKQFQELGEQGMTVTCPGFYGPQDRTLRYGLAYQDLMHKLQSFQYDGMSILNFEMETAAILALGELLGHRCLSIATVLANRSNGTFANDVDKHVDTMIEKGLSLLLAEE